MRYRVPVGVWCAWREGEGKGRFEERIEADGLAGESGVGVRAGERADMLGEEGREKRVGKQRGV